MREKWLGALVLWTLTVLSMAQLGRVIHEALSTVEHGLAYEAIGAVGVACASILLLFLGGNRTTGAKPTGGTLLAMASEMGMKGPQVIALQFVEGFIEGIANRQKKSETDST